MILAALIMRLVERGTLDLDRPIVGYLLGFSFSDSLRGGQVTLRHLLSHTSGLASAGKNWGPCGRGALRDFVHQQIPHYGFVAESGRVYEYSNTAICVAGHVAEAATGDAYRDLVGEPVLQRCADQLAGFLRALHTLPAPVLEAAVPGERARFQPLVPWEHLHARIRQRLFPHLRPDARRSVDERFDAFLSNPAHATIVPALIHGDFGPGNWLYDPGRGQITEVVDFDHAGLGDPAVDLAAASTAAAASPHFVSRFRRSCGRAAAAQPP